MTTATALRFTSGLASLDAALTDDGQPTGAFTPGTVTVIGGTTCVGKTTLATGMAAAAAQQLRDAGLNDARVLFVQAEEMADLAMDRMQIHDGQRNEHLAHNIDVHHVGTQLQLVATALYAAIRRAVQQSTADGSDLAANLPYVLFVDYLQGLGLASGRTRVEQVSLNAQLLAAAARCDLDEVARIAGISYEECTGEQLPDFGGHQMAVITTAFTVTMPWHERHVPTRAAELRAYEGIEPHADVILMLHRPETAQPLLTGEHGRYLADPRAQITVEPTDELDDPTTVNLLFQTRPDGRLGQFSDQPGGITWPAT